VQCSYIHTPTYYHIIYLHWLHYTYPSHLIHSVTVVTSRYCISLLLVAVRGWTGPIRNRSPRVKRAHNRSLSDNLWHVHWLSGRRLPRLCVCVDVCVLLFAVVRTRLQRCSVSTERSADVTVALSVSDRHFATRADLRRLEHKSLDLRRHAYPWHRSQCIADMPVCVPRVRTSWHFYTIIYGQVLGQVRPWSRWWHRSVYKY
jgi:hypothetical protein